MSLFNMFNYFEHLNSYLSPHAAATSSQLNSFNPTVWFLPMCHLNYFFKIICWGLLAKKNDLYKYSICQERSGHERGSLISLWQNPSPCSSLPPGIFIAIKSGPLNILHELASVSAPASPLIHFYADMAVCAPTHFFLQLKEYSFTLKYNKNH